MTAKYGFKKRKPAIETGMAADMVNNVAAVLQRIRSESNIVPRRHWRTRRINVPGLSGSIPKDWGTHEAEFPSR